MELGVLQHPLNHILYVYSLGHTWRCHYVECSQTGISRFSHPFHDKVAPQPLFVHRIITLQIPNAIS